LTYSESVVHRRVVKVVGGTLQDGGQRLLATGNGNLALFAACHRWRCGDTESKRQRCELDGGELHIDRRVLFEVMCMMFLLERGDIRRASSVEYKSVIKVVSK
jgi:hypothetical protein